MERLASCETILCDGTFKIAPDPYFQIYTIFGDFKNCQIPLVFALLTGKTSDHYKVMLNILKEKMEKIDKVFKPDNILYDYESGFKAAVAEDFPESRHIGCYFHFTQALIKKLRSLGLITAYRFNQIFKKQMRKTFALAFLLVALVRNYYRTFVNSPKFLALKTRYPELQKFTEYFEKIWLDFFPIKFWNVFDRETNFRTTNCCEGRNSRWNKKIRKKMFDLAYN